MTRITPNLLVLTEAKKTFLRHFCIRRVWTNWVHLSIKERLEKGLIGKPLTNRWVSQQFKKDATMISRDDIKKDSGREKVKWCPRPKKFNDEQCQLIRSLYSKKNNYRVLAKKFDTCIATIDHILNKKGAYCDELKRA